MRKSHGINFFLLITVCIVSVLFISVKADAGGVWIGLNDPQPAPQSGGIFETALKFTTWDAAMGAYLITVHYDPSLLQILQVTMPAQSEFYGNIFVDTNSFASGTTDITAFQVVNLSAQASPATFATIQWKSLGAAGTSATIGLEAKTMIDSFWRPVDVFSTNITFEIISPSDTTPPTPNPMTWATEPYADSSTSITMVATTATDNDSPPVSYYFDFVDSPTGGTGGSYSGWQSSTSYTDSGLQPNHQYGYRVKAKDSAFTPNETSHSLTVYKYTLANVPVSASFSNVTLSSIQANWTINGNRSGTEYWCENITSGANSGWTTNTYWNNSGLSCGTFYTYRVKARNGDGLETGWTNIGSQSTQACDTIPDITANPSPLNFRSVNVGKSSVKAVTVTNTGTADLVIGAIDITGTDASEFSILSDTCSGQTIASSGTCRVDVRFSPTSGIPARFSMVEFFKQAMSLLTPGAYKQTKSAILGILSNDPDTSTLDVPLSGKGYATMMQRILDIQKVWQRSLFPSAGN